MTHLAFFITIEPILISSDDTALCHHSSPVSDLAFRPDVQFKMRLLQMPIGARVSQLFILLNIIV